MLTTPGYFLIVCFGLPKSLNCVQMCFFVRCMLLSTHNVART